MKESFSPDLSSRTLALASASAPLWRNEMDLLHVALACSSEDRADAFYVGLLGLRKSAPKIVAAEICRAIFGLDRELTAINYIGGSANFEVFICPEAAGRVAHACVGVEDPPALLRKCEEAQVEIIRVPKGESLITFLRDADGNLFEIKEKSKASGR